MGNAGVIGPDAKWCSACSGCSACFLFAPIGIAGSIGFVGLW